MNNRIDAVDSIEGRTDKSQVTATTLDNKRYLNVNSADVNIIEERTPLLSGQTYTSNIIDFKGYRYLRTELATDQDGILRGFWYDSPEKTNLIRTFQIPYDSSGGVSLTGTEVFARYLEYQFENTSGVNQSYLYFNVNKSNTPLSGQLIRVDQFVPENVLAELTRSILVGLDRNNVYQNVKVNEFGVLSSSSFLLDVARGVYPGISSFTKNGRNSDINTTTTPETVWNGGGVYTGQPVWGTPAEAVEVFSSNVNDSLAGTGARTVTLFGLDFNGNRIQATIELNGTTPVIIPGLEWARLNYARVVTSGSSGTNLGEITARAIAIPSRVFMVMPARVGVTAIGASTTPLGKNRVILKSRCTIARAGGQSGSANVRLMIRPPGESFYAAINEEVTNSSFYEQPDETFIILPELSDIKWEVASVSNNSTIVTCKIPWVEFDND